MNRAAFLSLALMGCLPYSTGSTEVGVRIAKFGIFEARGVVPDPYPPGTTTFFMPVLNVPFRLIAAWNPQREGVFNNQLQPQKAFTFRFAVGSTF